jgi:hypothetical protein
MENDFITIVSGEPRSGTSLMMQTLGLLGLDIAGHKLSIDRKGRKRTERAQYLNPKGFYEIPGVVMRGFDAEKLGDYKGKAIKLITPGMVRTMKDEKVREHVNKIIFCLRHPKEIALSQRKLASAVEVAVDGDWKYFPETLPASPKRYVKAISWLVLWVQGNMDIWQNVHLSNYERMLTDPEGAIKDIIKYLEIEPTEEQIQQAIDNIDTSLYRSTKDAVEWEDPEQGALAEALYEGICTNTMKHIDETMIDDIAEMMRVDRLENIRWLDDEEFGTWTRMTASLWRGVEINNNNVRVNLQKGAVKRHVQWSTRCAYYNRKGEEYVIPRPDDIGPLVRNKVRCEYHGEDKTREQCYKCWNETINNRKLP